MVIDAVIHPDDMAKRAVLFIEVVV